MKETGWRVLRRKMGIRRARMVKMEKRRSCLSGMGCLLGEWKDYTLGKSRVCTRKKGNSKLQKGGYRRR